MSTLAERFKEAIGQRKIKLKDLAIAAGVQPPSVSDWLNGETLTLKAETAIKAANFLGVNALWLASGVGTMRGQEADAQGTAAMLQTNTEPGPDIRGSAGSTPTIADLRKAIRGRVPQDDANFLDDVTQGVLSREVPEHIRLAILTLIASSPEKKP